MMTQNAGNAESDRVGWRFDNSYARLPESLFDPATPVAVPEPRVVIVNHDLAAELGLQLGTLTPDASAALFAGQELPPGSQPIAQAYAGHQFGGFTMLGDGRAILLGEHQTPSGRRVDIQFKGSGRTRFSRGGDGRAALGPMLREYLISEAMAALGIPSTRCLAVVTTGEPVYRESIRQGAILTRVAASHIRVGTFEYAARRGEPILRALADHTIARHDPDLADTTDQKYLRFFRDVARRQAHLVARWQLVGFIHGVMNTDNVAISGETIDYGPCAFMNAYDPDTVFSSIDHGGRYAFGNQPRIMQWNLARFAETLLTLFDPDPHRSIELANAVLDEFPGLHEQAWLAGMRQKLGLLTNEPDDAELIQSLLSWMHARRADFTNTFHRLSQQEGPTRGSADDPEFQAWLTRWQERLGRNGQPRELALSLMRSVNPAVIPRNHRVEEALSAAEQANDLAPLQRLLNVLANPFAGHDLPAEYQAPPADESHYRTFCGT